MKGIYTAIILVIFVTACGSDGNGSSGSNVVQDTEQTQTVIELSAASDKDRSALVASPQDVSRWVTSINQFAFTEFALTSDTSNFLQSSYQQQVMFASSYIAASGITKTEISDFFIFENAEESFEFLSAFNSLEQKFLSTASYINQSYLWGQNTYPFALEYLDSIVEYLGVDVKTADFINSPSAFITDINKTFDHSEITEEYNINDKTKLVFATQGYFSGSWKSPFEMLMNEGDFTLLDTSKTEVPLISATVDVNFYEQGDEVFIALPFEDSEWSLYLYTTYDVDQFSSLKNSLSEEKIAEIQASSVLTSIELVVPAFAFQQAEAITALGSSSLENSISSALNKYDANFSVLNEGDIDDVYLNRAHHTSAIEFTAGGMEFGFGAYSVLEDKPLPETENPSYNSLITINNPSFSLFEPNTSLLVSFQQPFLYFLQHQASGAIILMGSVTDPR